MKLDDILQTAGKQKTRRRTGRGIGSGRGKTCGRGHKGYGSRAGAKKRLGYEGGQNPTLARIPKRGFTNARFRKDFQIVNVAGLDCFEDGIRVDAAALSEARLISDIDRPVKILGKGGLKKKLTVVATMFSASAVEKIVQAGGTVEKA